jgi:diadenosine tetraphosphate (Ap4A) HIT family hydrolase
VSLERIWAGWRMPYIKAAADEARQAGAEGDVPGEDECVFCEILSLGGSDEERFIVWRGDAVVVMLNAYPYTSGHLLVFPVRHVGQAREVSSAESAEMWEATVDALDALNVAYRPDGHNLGANLGRAAGAGVPGHFHLHVLPRWSSDANFMTSVAEARVLPESLPDTWRRLRVSWPR